MTDKEVTEILDDAYSFFFDLFKDKAISFNKKKYSSFKNNPFTIRACAKCFGDDKDPKNIAKAIVYPFALGTSLSTSFGTKFQEFIVNYSENNNKVSGSGVSGVDIEYIDALDNRKKYCQIKSGPTTINKDDIKTIEDHFINLKNLARTNHLQLQDDDYVVGVLYGDNKSLSTMYKTLYKDGFNVYAGQEFWYHITGRKDIYEKLIKKAQEAATNAKMDDSINKLLITVEEGIKKDLDFFGI